MKNENFLALTFDDGPNEPYTSQIADILKKHQVRATFFQVGQNVIKHPQICWRLAADGHVIGNHSFSHSFPKLITAKSLAAEIGKTQEIIYDTVGSLPAFYRPPWLFRSPALNGVLRQFNLVPVLGVFGHRLEFLQPKAESMAAAAVKKVEPGTVLIFHDGYDNRGGDRSQTVRAVEILVPQLLKRGYKFVTVEDLAYSKSAANSF